MKKVNFNMLIDEDLKKRFIKIAKQNDETASQLMRKYIKDYVSKNSQLVFKD